jgi:tetratricopeptide (TPR) repeat protein
MSGPSRSLVFVAVSVLATVALARPAAGQIPDEYTNLQVLPEDISRGEILTIMRGFTAALGMRCSNCHVGEEGQPLDEYDFASDDRISKQKARAMMRMVADINGTHLAELPRARGIEVTCITCHSGVRRPETIEAIMLREHESDGVEAALERYAALRDQYYGSAAYDFREAPLRRVAEQIAEAGAHADALRVLEATAELFPDSAFPWIQMGGVHEQLGDTDAAIRAYERSLELLPDNPPATRRLRVLRGG